MEGSESGILGCDYSSRVIYLGHVQGKKVEHTSSISIEGEQEPAKRGFYLLKGILNTLAYTVGDIYIERPIVNAKFTSPLTGMMLTRTATFVEIAAIEVGMKVHFIPISTWRKIIFGTNRLDHPKDAAVEFVKRELNFEVPTMGVRKIQPDHNFAEAICIAYAGYLQEKIPSIT